MTTGQNKPSVGISDDYATLNGNGVAFYYGYEVTKGDEWCFRANFNGREITIPFSKLGARDQFDCVDCLLTGIGWIFAAYELHPSLIPGGEG